MIAELMMRDPRVLAGVILGWAVVLFPRWWLNQIRRAWAWVHR